MNRLFSSQLGWPPSAAAEGSCINPAIPENGSPQQSKPSTLGPSSYVFVNADQRALLEGEPVPGTIIDC
jgi:hypothetical protein